VITRVKLRNWKSHAQTEVTFGDGTNVLVGPMGSGKSSVLEAITYALFGTLPSIKSRTIKLEDLITSRPRPMNEAEVEVWFVAPDGEEYAVRRVIKRGVGTSLSEIRKANGEVIESHSSSRVNEIVNRLIRLDYDLFERAVYSEQNRLDHFLTIPKGRRMESIDELLGINKLEAVRKRIGSVIKRVRDRAVECRENARRYMGEKDVREMQLVQDEISKLDEEIGSIERRLGEIQPELKETKKRIDELSAVERELRESEGTVQGLRGRVESLSHQIESLGRRLGEARSHALEEIIKCEAFANEKHRAKLNEVDGLNSRYTRALSRLSQLDAEKALITESLRGLEQKVRLKREKLEELKKLSPGELKEATERLESRRREIQESLTGNRVRAHEAERSLYDLKGAGSTCPVCETPLDEKRKKELILRKEELLKLLWKEIASGEEELQRIREEVEAKQRDLEKCSLLERETANISELEGEIQGLVNRLGEVEKERTRLSREIDSLKGAIEQARHEEESLRKELSEVRKVLLLRKEHERMIEEQAKLEEELKKALSRLEELRGGFDETLMAEARKKWEELYAVQRGLQVELSGKESLVREKRKALESAKEKVKEAKRQELTAKHLEAAVGMLSSIQVALSKTQTSMRRMFVDGVNEVMGDLWESLYPYGDFVGIQLFVTGEGRTGDYVLMLRERSGNWVPVEGLVSGGERTDACLALRIAFSIVLAPNLKWIVFDEPTHNLDQDAIQELAKVLRERLPEVVRQVLLITHEERLESAVSGYLYRFSRNKRADEPTRVEQVSAPFLR